LTISFAEPACIANFKMLLLVEVDIFFECYVDFQL